MHLLYRVLLVVALVSFNHVVFAQQTACKDEQYQQFDFWLGEWWVTSAPNQPASSSKISKILGNCVIFEEYETPSGYIGKSLNIYNIQNKKWHQTWTDNTGLLLQLDGELVDGSMVLRGQGTDQNGKLVLHQITWTPVDNGTVNQHWQQSSDNGNTWKSLFNGTYTQKKSVNSQ